MLHPLLTKFTILQNNIMSCIFGCNYSDLFLLHMQLFRASTWNCMKLLHTTQIMNSHKARRYATNGHARRMHRSKKIKRRAEIMQSGRCWCYSIIIASLASIHKYQQKRTWNGPESFSDNIICKRRWHHSLGSIASMPLTEILAKPTEIYSFFPIPLDML